MSETEPASATFSPLCAGTLQMVSGLVYLKDSGIYTAGRSNQTGQRRDQTKPSTWSSSLGVGLTVTTLPNKNQPVTETTTTTNIIVVALCPTGDEKDK